MIVWPPSCTLVAPSAKPLPDSCRLAPTKPPPAPMVTSLSVGTICSSTPASSRARRTRPVVALTGTTAVRVCPATSTLAGVTVTSERLPLSSSVVKTRVSVASRPVPLSVMLWPVLALARLALAAVPLAARAALPVRWLLPAASRSRLSV